MFKNINYTCTQAKNQWEYVLNQLNISTNRKESECPSCGGKTRYRFDDIEGRGTHFCSHCGAGDGLNLIMKVYQCNAKEAAKKVAKILGLQSAPEQEKNRRIEKPKTNVVNKVRGLLKHATQAESIYLKNKGLKGMHSILKDDSLLLPLVTINGDITGAQIIKPSGEKKLILDTKKKGAFIPVGEFQTKPDTIFITEGYATAMTIEMIADGYVVAAVDAGNILLVAESFRAKYPDAEIYICGDNDISYDGSNVGREAAEKAAKAVGGKVSIPQTDYKCDWNDYFQTEGFEKLAEAFYANLKTPLNKVGRPAKEKTAQTTEFPCDLVVNERTGKYQTTLDNVYKASQCHEITGLKFKYDDFRGAEMVFMNDQWVDINDNTITDLRLRLDRLGMPNVRHKEARSVINFIAQENHFDSGVDWINSLKWDGTPRVKSFFSNYFSVNGNDEYVESVSQYAWTALAGRMIQPGIKADMVPVLYGKQGVGKSTGIEKMCPFNDAFTKVDLSKKDEDLARKIRGCVIAEWEELRGLNGRDSESTKAFISATSDTWIPKYKEFATTNPRRLLFIGTTNKKEILTDCTGNRRYLPLDVGKVDFEAIEKDRDQLWAEALVLFKANGIMWEKSEKLAENEHDQYKMQDPWEDELHDYLEVGSKKEMQFASTQSLFSRLGLLIGHTSRHHAERLKNVMSIFGYNKERRRVHGQQKHGYFKVSSCFGFNQDHTLATCNL